LKKLQKKRGLNKKNKFFLSKDKTRSNWKIYKKGQENRLKNKKNHDWNCKKQKNNVFRLKDEIEKKNENLQKGQGQKLQIKRISMNIQICATKRTILKF